MLFTGREYASHDPALCQEADSSRPPPPHTHALLLGGGSETTAKRVPKEHVHITSDHEVNNSNKPNNANNKDLIKLTREKRKREREKGERECVERMERMERERERERDLMKLTRGLERDMAKPWGREAGLVVMSMREIARLLSV